MRTLVIYDLSGAVWLLRGGNYIVPDGIPYLEVDVPEGKRITGVDISGDEHIPIFEDIPKMETQLLQEQLAEIAIDTDYRLSLIELGLI